MEQRTTYNKGFSLIEVLITVGIIAVIAAIAVPTYNEYRVKSRRSECLSTMPELMKIALLFETKTESVPCRVGSRNYYTGTCGTADELQIALPLQNVSAASDVYYGYDVSPASRTTRDDFYPNVVDNNNKLGKTANEGDNNSAAQNRDFESTESMNVKVVCFGAISKYTTTATAKADELFLLDNGEVRIYTDQVLDKDWGATEAAGHTY